jgi:hypothetical protein
MSTWESAGMQVQVDIERPLHEHAKPRL